MKIINITSQEQLNSFVSSQPYSQFLQSWEWGEFQTKVAGRVWRFGVEDNNELIASAKVIEKILPMGQRYFYCARGPIISYKFFENKEEDKIREALELIFEEIEKIAQEEKVMFLRFDPLHHIYNNEYKIVQTHSVQPRQTLILDIFKTEEELLKEMHQKTRYNINLASKKGVQIIEGSKERFEDFWHLLDQTSGRDKFRPHGRNYYQTMLELPNNFLKLIFAEYEGKTIATGIFSLFGDTATYLHGGSANEYREVMGPYLLQWHVIKLAKKQNYKYYDFHGIDQDHYPGVTRFKKGFGGREYNFPGTFDIIYDESWYTIYKMVRKIRRTF